jgi:peptidyl-prolyl cis-trans isomerase A (cyclophilin A)
MGSPAGEGGRDSDEVQHKVTITRGFWLKTTEVTQGEWIAMMGSNPSHFEGCGANCPVDNVSWSDAVAYCNKLSERDNLQQCYVGERFVGPGCTGYRLPTESEWEYAARAGTTGARHGELEAVAWHAQNSSATTHPVGQKLANAWGLYDMLGNVWEWTNDWKGVYPSSATDPVGPDWGWGRIVRGGCWYDGAALVRSASRFDYEPGFRNVVLGFRPARSVPSGPGLAPGAVGTAAGVDATVKDHKLPNEKAPDEFMVRFNTSKGAFTVAVHRGWSPIGADRFYNLVRIGYFRDVAFFRAIAGFMAQFGIHGDRQVNAVWGEAFIKDDPSANRSNKAYTLAFAKGVPNSRSVQFFINFKDNSMLDQMGFTPVGEVVEGKDVVDRINTEYGEGAPRGIGPDQTRIQTEGNAYLKKNFPNLDYIKSAWIL